MSLVCLQISLHFVTSLCIVVFMSWFAWESLGNAEAEIRRAFRLARQAHPCVLFLDELDALVTDRCYWLSCAVVILSGFY